MGLLAVTGHAGLAHGCVAEFACGHNTLLGLLAVSAHAKHSMICNLVVDCLGELLLLRFCAPLGFTITFVIITDVCAPVHV